MEWANGLNRWYDDMPEHRRMLVVPIVLIVVGGINMALTISGHFPFGLLFLVALLALVAIRAPFVWNLGSHAGSHAAGIPPAKIEIEGFDWLYDMNLQYDALPDSYRFAVIPGVLIVVGGLNMALTIAHRFPFGILFLLALLLVVAFRAPFVMGWLKPPTRAVAAVPASAPAAITPSVTEAEPMPSQPAVAKWRSNGTAASPPGSSQSPSRPSPSAESPPIN